MKQSSPHRPAANPLNVIRIQFEVVGHTIEKVGLCKRIARMWYTWPAMNLAHWWINALVRKASCLWCHTALPFPATSPEIFGQSQKSSLFWFYKESFYFHCLLYGFWMVNFQMITHSSQLVKSLYPSYFFFPIHRTKSCHLSHLDSCNEQHLGIQILFDFGQKKYAKFRIENLQWGSYILKAEPLNMNTFIMYGHL